MKNNKLIILLVLGLASIWSCNKHDFDFQDTALKTAPAVISPEAGTSFTVTTANIGDNQAVEWSAADFGFSGVITYTIQVDKAGANFSAPQNLGTTIETSMTVDVLAINNAALALGCTRGDTGALEMRVCATTSGVDAAYSTTIPFDFTTFVVYPVITGPTVDTTYMTTFANVSSDNVTIDWTAADYGNNETFSYNVQIALTGTDFTDIITTTSVSGLTYSEVFMSINDKLIALGYTHEELVALEARVIASADGVEPATSNVSTFKFEVFDPLISYLYAPGDYQGWDPGSAPSLISPVSNGVYEGYIYFTSTGGMKFTTSPDWTNPDYGETGPGTIGLGMGGNITIPGMGYYYVVVNTNDGTWTATPTTWGIIGSAVPPYDWSEDLDMTYDPETNSWSVVANLVAGEMKFRANDRWNLDFGDDEPDGNAEYGGANIPITEDGEYLITLYLTPNQEGFYYYTVGPATSYLYVPGDHQGWDPATAPVLASPESDGVYEGYVNFPGGGGFKLTVTPDWTNDDYGETGTGMIGLGMGGNITAPADAGYYRVGADTNALTWSATKTEWGLIGDAVPPYDWSVDQDLTYDATTDTWSITIALNAGEYKFRANDGWDIDFGDNGADGSLEYGGSNISLATAGTYTITLDLSGGLGSYTYTIE